MTDNFYLKFKFEEYDKPYKIKMILFIYDNGSYDLIACKNNRFDIIKKGIIELDNIIYIMNTIMERNLAKNYIESDKFNVLHRITFFNEKGEEEYIETNTANEQPSIIKKLVRMFSSFVYENYKEFYGQTNLIENK